MNLKNAVVNPRRNLEDAPGNILSSEIRAHPRDPRAVPGPTPAQNFISSSAVHELGWSAEAWRMRLTVATSIGAAAHWRHRRCCSHMRANGSVSC